MRRWFLVCTLSIGLGFAYTHRSNISFALADKNFIAFFGLTDTGRSTLASAFFWTYGLLQIPAGSLVDRFGAKWPLACGLFVWCLFSAATGLAGTFWTVLALRLLLGMAETIVTPAGLRWIHRALAHRPPWLARDVSCSGTCRLGMAGPVAAV
jgi:ACS family D-galactonate transporter-like MFS transporter